MKRAVWTLVAGLFCIGFGLFVIISNSRYMFGGKPADLNELIKENPDISSSEIEDKDVVSLKIDYSFGNFAIEKNKSYGIPMGEKKFYIIYLEDDSVMAVAVKGDDVRKMEAITNHTLSQNGYTGASTIRLEGAVYKIVDTDLKKYYDNALTNLGIKGVEGNQIKMRYIYIDASTNRKSMWLVSGLSLLAGIFLLFGEVIFYSIKERKNKKTAAVINDDRFRESAVSRNISADEPISTPNRPFSVGEHYKKLHEAEEGNDKSEDEPEDVPFNRTDNSDRTKDGKLSTDGWNLMK